jgi:hypothetical protein
MPRPAPVTRERPAASTAAADAVEAGVRFGPRNLAFLAAGLAVIIGGFVLLAGGSTVAAPLLLVLGYAVLIPIGIIL